MVVFSGTLQDLAKQLLQRSNYIDDESRPSRLPKIPLPDVNINELKQVIENLSVSNGQPPTYLGQSDYPVELHGQVVILYPQYVHNFAYDPQTQKVIVTQMG